MKFSLPTRWLTSSVIACSFIAAAYQSSPSTPSKEYIRLNGRVIAIESSVAPVVQLTAPGGAQVVAGGIYRLTAVIQGTNQTADVTWNPVPGGVGSLQTVTGGGNALRDYVAPSTIANDTTVTISAVDSSGRTISVDLLLKQSTTTATVGLAAGETSIYEAIRSGATSWTWSAPAVGQLDPISGGPSNRRQYTPPSRNYCAQSVVIAASTPVGGGMASGSTTRSVPVANTALPAPTFNTDIPNGSSVELTAGLDGYNCPQSASWEWTYTPAPQYIQSLGNGRYRFSAPTGTYTLVARELNSNVSGNVTVRVLAANAAIISVAPNPIRLGIGAGINMSASVSTSNGSFSWSPTSNLSVTQATGPTTCVTAIGGVPGSGSVVVTNTASGASSVNVPVTIVSASDTTATQARITITPTGGARNLTSAAPPFNASAINVCGTPTFEWSVSRVNSSGTSLPAGTMDGSATALYTPPAGGLSEGDLITFTARIPNTDIFHSVGIVHRATVGDFNLNPNPLVTSAGGTSTQFYATNSSTAVPITAPINWTIQPGGYGVVITNLGKLTPPFTIDVPRDFIIKAINPADFTYGTATVRINGSCNPTLTMTATPSQVAPGDTVTLNPTNSCPGTWNYSYEFTPSGGTWNPTLKQYTIPAGASAGTFVAKATLLDSQSAATSFYATAASNIVLLPVVSVTPAGPISLFPGQSQTFNASVANAANANVTWGISPAAPAGSSASGNSYTFTSNVVSADTSHTLTATSVQDPSRSKSVTVVRKAITVSVTTGPTSINSGQSGTYGTNINFGTVNWSVSPSTHASITSSTGILTAGTSFTTSQNVVVTATSAVDPTKQATYNVTLIPAVTVSNIRPTLVYQKTAATQMLADVTGTANTALTWTKAENGDSGTITSAGVYTATAWIPDSTTITLTARSQADTTKTATQSVLVRQGITADTLSPASGTGQSQSFTNAFTLRDTSSTINHVYMNIGANLSSTLCSVSYNQTNSTFYLWTNNTPAAVPAGGSQTNSQCTLSRTGSSATYSNNVLTVVYNITFASGFSGAKNVYLYGEGNGGTLTGGHILKGTWTVPAPPITVTINPSTQVTLQAGGTQAYTATVTTGGISWTKSISGGSLSATSGTSTTFTAPSPISTNQYMTIRATSTSDATKFAEATIYLSSVPPPPTVTSVTPVNGTGSTPTFTITATHPSGGSNITGISLGLAYSSSTVGEDGTCQIGMSYAGGEFGWLAGINAHPPYYEYQNNFVGQYNSLPLQNSVCKSRGDYMSAGATGGNGFSATIPIEFQPAFSGTFNVYAMVGSVWQYFGTWTK